MKFSFTYRINWREIQNKNKKTKKENLVCRNFRNRSSASQWDSSVIPIFLENTQRFSIFFYRNFSKFFSSIRSHQIKLSIKKKKQQQHWEANQIVNKIVIFFMSADNSENADKSSEWIESVANRHLRPIVSMKIVELAYKDIDHSAIERNYNVIIRNWHYLHTRISC